MFFLYKSVGGHAISRQKPRVPFGLPYLSIALFYIGMPVVRKDARAGGRTVMWLPKFLRCIDNQFFFTHGALLLRARAPLSNSGQSRVGTWWGPSHAPYYFISPKGQENYFPGRSLLLSCLHSTTTTTTTTTTTYLNIWICHYETSAH